MDSLSCVPTRSNTQNFFQPWNESVAFPDDLYSALIYASSSSDAVVITEAKAPFKIVCVNKPWTLLCEYEVPEAVGRTFRFMQGADTDAYSLEQLVDAVQQRQSVQIVLVNYKKSGRSFANFLRVKPLSSHGGGEITHYFGILKDHEEL
eukprot:gene25443-30723_t